MAGKRKQITLDMQLFTPTPIQAPTLRSWAGAVEVGDLHRAVAGSLVTNSGSHFDLSQSAILLGNSVLAAIELCHSVDKIINADITIRHTGCWTSGRLNDNFGLTLHDALVLTKDESIALRFLLTLGAFDYTTPVIERKSKSPLSNLGQYLTPAGLTLFCKINSLKIARD